MSLETVHIIVKGRVQGVGFRWFTQQNALRLGVRGYVRNKIDGSVEAVLQGSDKQVNQLLSVIAEGPPVSSVRDIIKTTLSGAKEYQEFSVTY